MNFLIRGILNFQSTITTPSSKVLYHKMLTICRIMHQTLSMTTPMQQIMSTMGIPNHFPFILRGTKGEIEHRCVASHLIASHPPLVHIGHREDRDIMGFILVGFNSYVYVPTLVFRVS
mmetsp:Transcript_5076/g.14738  ORF Transcript_5076/g.14738 Transcript_5076/m.14738 type:complete len:118 (-) Transcript_5076:496-849(-)